VVTIVAALFVLILAAGSLLWPAGQRGKVQGLVLVFDSGGDTQRTQRVYTPLARFLEAVAGQEMKLKIVTTRDQFDTCLAQGVDFVLAPDGLALQLNRLDFEPLVVGRRPAPRNLRPRGVLLYRKSESRDGPPAVLLPERIAFGDSLSLVCRPRIPELAQIAGAGELRFGPDPYDHGPVIHAARLGAFDYVVVRGWDAERFLAGGLLDHEHWGMRSLTGPVPDLVLAAAKQLPGAVRVDARESLAALGRGSEPQGELGAVLAEGLSVMHLAGFNILLEPDLDRYRENGEADWQAPPE
jgi:hypothetical protein